MKKRQKSQKLRFFYHLTFIVIVLTSGYLAELSLNYETSAQVTSVLNSPKIQPRIPFSQPVPILIYHYVEYVKDQGDTIRQSLNIQPHILDTQIKTLLDAGYTFITPSEISDVENGNLNLSGKPIIITFDDGYRDFYTDVFPILKKYQIKAIVYVVTGFLDKPNNLDWRQLKEIAQSGLVEVGAHSISHPSLESLSYQSAKKEINQSKSELEKGLQTTIVSFAYPFGSYNQEIIELLKEANFSTAVSSIEGSNLNLENKYLLKRIHPGARVDKDLTSHLDNLNKSKEDSIKI